jgi:hypothetical protein
VSCPRVEVMREAPCLQPPPGASVTSRRVEVMREAPRRIRTARVARVVRGVPPALALPHRVRESVGAPARPSPSLPCDPCDPCGSPPKAPCSTR